VAGALLLLGALVGVHAAPTDLGVLVEARRQAWDAMNDSERTLFRQRLEDWERMPHDAAGEQRERYLALQALDGVDRAMLRETRELYASLPGATQRELRERFDQLTVTEQRGWLLGPRLGADFAQLSPLLLQVPPDQRTPLLEMLRVMTAEERADLAVLAHRTPPQERDALRRALLETTDSNRAAWLRLRLER
jgi:hypothetical protein